MRDDGDQQQSLREGIERCSKLDELVEHLGAFLAEGAEFGDGFLIRRFVDQVGPLRVEIHTNDHAPPHFHVFGDGVEAAIVIETGKVLEGNLPGRDLRRIGDWLEDGGRAKAARIWNATRPTDCPAGPTRPA